MFRAATSSRVFLWSFVAAFLLQLGFWSTFMIIDQSMWAQQGPRLVAGDPEVFNANEAYGHPGGTIIEGVLLVRAVLPLSPDAVLNTFLAVCNALVIAAVSLLVYVLRRDLWWCALVVGMLSANKLYLDTTPTSALVAPLVVLLALYTLAILEKKVPLRPAVLAGWGMISGLAVATRADIGACMSLAFLGALLGRLSVSHVVLLFGTAAAVFVASDPFMWFMPIQHLADLFHKVFYHYAEFTPSPLRLSAVAEFSLLAVVSIALSGACLAGGVATLPRRFLGVLYVVTIVLYVVFLSSQYQAVRYFVPILFVWEALLPLFVLALLRRSPQATAGWVRASVAAMLFFVHALVLVQEFVFTL